MGLQIESSWASTFFAASGIRLSHQRGPLQVLAGETWTAGNCSLHSAFQPLVLVDRTPDADPLPDAVAAALAGAADRVGHRRTAIRQAGPCGGGSARFSAAVVSRSVMEVKGRTSIRHARNPSISVQPMHAGRPPPIGNLCS